MLNKFNDLYGKLIYENTEDQWIRKINNDNDFYSKYLLPLNKKYFVNTCKARLNTFRIGGEYDNVINALKGFSVDNEFWNDDIFQRKFMVYSPMVTFAEVIHKMNFDEGMPENTVNTNSLYALQNTARGCTEGRWYELFDNTQKEFGFPIKVKSATPTDLCKFIEDLCESLSYTPENKILVVEFQINCENFANQIYDEQTTFVPLTNLSDTNELNNTTRKDVEPSAKCELPKENTENEVKIPVSNKKGKLSLKKAYINEYDAKNKYKKTVNEIK